MPRQTFTIEDISHYYDTMTDFMHVLMGESLHLGYWPDPDADMTLPEAQEHFTDLMIRQIELQPGQRMLDVGCGTGQPALRLAQVTGGAVVGITINQMQVERANERARQHDLGDRVHFELANALELPYADASFDAAWAFESLFHMPDRVKALREIGRVVRPGGRIIIADIVEAVPLPEERKAAFLSAFTANILTPLDQYYQDLQTAGLTVLETIDITRNTRPSMPAGNVVLQQPHIREQLLNFFGDPALVDSFGPYWADLADAVERYIGYIILVARPT